MIESPPTVFVVDWLDDAGYVQTRAVYERRAEAFALEEMWHREGFVDAGERTRLTRLSLDHSFDKLLRAAHVD